MTTLSDEDKQAALEAYCAEYGFKLDDLEGDIISSGLWLRAWALAHRRATQAAYERAAQLLETNVVDTNHLTLLPALPYRDAVRHTFSEAIRTLAKGSTP